jgi:hypothetical protein
MGKSTEIQRHTDKYQLLGVLDPDTGEIKPLKMGDDTISGLAAQMYVWNTSTVQWEKMQQPTIEAGDLYVAVDDLEQYTLDQLLQYKLDDFDVSGDPVYIGYQDKDGNYYIKRVNLSTGAVDYTVGTSGYSSAWTNRASESYSDFASKF